MSMAVDLSTPLTDKERAYLAERGRYADLERAGNTEPLGEGDGTASTVVPATNAEYMATEEERILTRLRELNPERYKGVTLAAIEASEAESDEGDEGDEGDEDDIAPYSEWHVPELDAELKRRNLPGGGTKPEKVARLEQDDQAATQA